MKERLHFGSEGADFAAFTARDFTDMISIGAFGDIHVELVGGELHKMMPANLSHGEMNGLVFAKLLTACAGVDVRLAIDLVVAIDDETVRAADVAIVRRDAPDTGPVGAAQILLLVEIADTTLGRDLGSKLRDYARAGVPEYWVVDLAARVVHVMRDPERAGYAHRQVVSFESTLGVPHTNRTVTIA